MNGNSPGFLFLDETLVYVDCTTHPCLRDEFNISLVLSVHAGIYLSNNLNPPSPVFRIQPFNASRRASSLTDRRPFSSGDSLSSSYVILLEVSAFVRLSFLALLPRSRCSATWAASSHSFRRETELAPLMSNFFLPCWTPPIRLSLRPLAVQATARLLATMLEFAALRLEKSNSRVVVWTVNGVKAYPVVVQLLGGGGVDLW